MADTLVTNRTATALGLYDVDGSYKVAGGLGGQLVVDPDMASADIINTLKAAGEITTGTPEDPNNSEMPAIVEDGLVVGQTISCDGGTWSGNPAPDLSYQWQADDDGWEDIDGATGATLVLTADLVGLDVRCVVTAVSVAGTDTENTSPVGPIEAAVEPSSDDAPIASGDSVAAGEIVECDGGTWLGNPEPELSFQWQFGEDETWTDIPGMPGTASDLFLTPEMVGFYVRCVVTATSVAGSATATSNALGPVVAAEEP